MMLMWLNDTSCYDTWGHIFGIQIKFMDDQENGIAGYKSGCW